MPIPALFELTFQLSFVSVLALLLMNRFYPLKVAKFSDKIISSAKTSLAASLATMPFIVNAFGLMSLVSVPANLICVPFIEFIATPLGLLSFLMYFLSETASALLLQINYLLVKSVIWAAEQFLRIPFAALTVPSWGWAASVFYALALIPALLWRTHPRWRFLLPVFALAFCLTAAYSVWGDKSGGKMRVSFLDAGSKNIAFAELPAGVNILVTGGFSYFDRGGFVERSVAIPFMLKSGVTEIDYFLIMSLDRDNIEGAKSIIERFRVKNLWTNGAKLDGGLWELIHANKIKWTNVSKPIEAVEIGDLRIQFIQPRGDFLPTDYRKPYPLLAKLDFRGMEFILAEGISEDGVESELIQNHSDEIRASVVNLSKISGKYADFLHTSAPKIIVTSSDSKTNSLNRDIGGVFRTETQGAVEIITDGNELRVRTFVDKVEVLY